MTVIQRELSDLRELIKSKDPVPAQMLEILDRVEERLNFQYVPDALTMVRWTIQAIGDDFGQDDPACARLRKIFVELRGRKAA